MIDWYGVLTATLWISGTALLLAGFSYQYWLAGEEKRPLREQLSQPSFLWVFYISMILIGMGLAGSSTRWWETAVWIVFIIFNIINLFQLSHPLTQE